MGLIRVIEEKLRVSVVVSYIDIIDESAKHRDHYYLAFPSGRPSHIKLILVSNDFSGMSPIKRYRLIHKILNSEIRQLHAISFYLYTQSEFYSRNKMVLI